MALAALAVALPLAAIAKPVGEYAPVIAGPGDQTDPSISGNWIVYASSVAGDFDVLRRAIGSASSLPVAVGPEDQLQADVNGTIVGHLGPGGVYVRDWNATDPIRAPGGGVCGGGTESQPTLGATVTAWECTAQGARSVVVLRHRETAPVEYALPGANSYAPAAFGSRVGFIDGAAGASVQLYDAYAGTIAPVCTGAATGVAVGALGARTIVATARGSQLDGSDADVEVWEPSLFVTALRIRGQQRNPHVSRDWVAFEDLSTSGSQVVLWQWTTGLVFLPHPSASDQTLNDLDALQGSEVRAVFAEAEAADPSSHDVALYRLFLNLDGTVRDDGTRWDPLPWDVVVPPPDPAVATSCDDTDAVVLATLSVTRGRGTPRAASVEFAARPGGDETPMPVLVCLEANGVTAGWMTLDDEAIAWPADFDLQRARVAIPAVAAGTSRLAAVIGGKPGATLVVRVLADPARPPPSCGTASSDGDDEAEHEDEGRDWDHDHDGDHDQGFGNSGWRRVPDWRFDRRICRGVPQPEGGAVAHGCSSGGAGGALALLALLLAAPLKRRR